MLDLFHALGKAAMASVQLICRDSCGVVSAWNILIVLEFSCEINCVKQNLSKACDL